MDQQSCISTPDGKFDAGYSDHLYFICIVYPEAESFFFFFGHFGVVLVGGSSWNVSIVFAIALARSCFRSILRSSTRFYGFFD